VATQDILLKDAEGNSLYPQTKWELVLNKPSFATGTDLSQKQDKLSAINSGSGITITTENGVLKISAVNASNYTALLNKPTLNGVVIDGALHSGDLFLPRIDNSSDGDFEISDDAGNVILRLSNGHITTQNFDSAALPTSLSALTNDVGFVTESYHDATK